MGERVPAAVREEVYRQSGGNPFYLQELARVSHGRRAAVRRRGRVGVPASVSAALGQEIDGAGRPRAAARLGRGRRGGSGGARPRHRRGRARARSRRWRRWRSWWSATCCGATTVPRRYAFRHPIVRRAVYEAAGEAWRLGAHARAAAALAGRPSAIAAQAHHVERSARVGDEAAAAILEQAAHQAAARAPAVAARWLSAALRLLPDPPDGSAERRLGMLVPLATALAASGRLEEALDTLLQTLEQIPPEQAELRVRLVAACAACENALGRHDAAHARLLHALAEFPDDGSAARGGPAGRARRRRALRQRLRRDAPMGRARGADGGGARRPGPAGGGPGARVLRRVRPGRCGAGRAGSRRERRRARRAARRAARAAPRPAVLPRVRRVLLRALRGRGATPAARHRAGARGRSGPVRRADDGRAGAGARAPRPPARGAEHRGGGGRGQPADRQPAGRRVRARRRGVDGRGAGRRRPRPRGRRRGRGAARRARRERVHARHARPRRRDLARDRRARPLHRAAARGRPARPPADRARAARLALHRPGARGARGRRPRGRRPSGWRAPRRRSAASSCRSPTPGCCTPARCWRSPTAMRPRPPCWRCGPPSARRRCTRRFPAARCRMLAGVALARGRRQRAGRAAADGGAARARVVRGQPLPRRGRAPPPPPRPAGQSARQRRFGAAARASTRSAGASSRSPTASRSDRPTGRSPTSCSSPRRRSRAISPACSPSSACPRGPRWPRPSAAPAHRTERF